MVDRAQARLVLRGYAPLIVMAVLFVVMVGFVPTVSIRVPAGGVGAYAGPAVGAPTPGDGGEQQAAPAVGGAAPGAPTGAARGGSGSTEVEAQPGRGLGSCEGKERQVPGDPYAPPCTEWAGGDNNGATWRGVTADTIKISFRTSSEKGFMQTLATLAGAEIVDTPEDVQRTAEAFEQFFNDHYQFYGRKLELVFHKGTGSPGTELLGGGRAEAAADAATSAETIGAFIEMNGSSEPYAAALVEKGVIAFGTPYLSRKWHTDRAPYAWSIATDCSIVAEAAAELGVKMLAGKPAKYAGGNQKDKPRVFAGISPENSWYQECHDDSIALFEAGGVPSGLKVNYKLDINSMSNQAANAVAQLKDYGDNGATTVFLGTDPIFPIFLTAKANEQGYQPEWVPVGTALTDWDVTAQLNNQEQWSRAFGVSSLGEPTPLRGGLGYTAYKTIRKDEPGFTVELLYGTLLLISTGIQLAGPNLTPQTFAAGLKSWPGGTGPFGTWGFGPDDYTPTRDYRIIWYDPEKVSIVNNQLGAYVTAYGGKRFPRGQFPTGDLQIFQG